MKRLDNQKLSTVEPTLNTPKPPLVDRLLESGNPPIILTVENKGNAHADNCKTTKNIV